MEIKAIPPHKARQRVRGGKRSATPGKQKNEWCQTDPQKRFFACSPKARRHPHYDEWHQKFKTANKG